MSALSIGIIGLDTTHVIDFTRLLNCHDDPYRVPGGKVTVAFPGGSPDFELSNTRVDGFTRELQERYGVEIVHSPAEVARQVDAILLESVDGRVHLQQFKEIAPFGKPVFIDKPLAVCYADACEIIRRSVAHKVPLMSSSALRYAVELTEALSDSGDGKIVGVDCFGPMLLQPTQPGLFWYGIHCAEVMFSVLGRGCVEVSAISNDAHDVLTAVWNDGRFGAIRGNRLGNSQFGVVVHRENTSRFIELRAARKPFYACLMEQVLSFFRTGESPIDLAETLEIIAFIESANKSLSTQGRVQLNELRELEDLTEAPMEGRQNPTSMAP